MVFRECTTTLGMDGEFLVKDEDNRRIHPGQAMDFSNGENYTIGRDGHATTWEMRIDPSTRAEDLVKNIGKVILAVKNYIPHVEYIETSPEDEPVGSHIWINSPMLPITKVLFDLFIGTTTSLSAPKERVIHRRSSHYGYGLMGSWRNDRSDPTGKYNMYEYRTPPSFWRTPRIAALVFNVASDIVSKGHELIIRSIETKVKLEKEMILNILSLPAEGDLSMILPSDRITTITRESNRDPFFARNITKHLYRPTADLWHPNLFEDVMALFEEVNKKPSNKVNIEEWEEFMKGSSVYKRSVISSPIVSINEYVEARSQGMMPYKMEKEVLAITDMEKIIAPLISQNVPSIEILEYVDGDDSPIQQINDQDEEEDNA